MRNPPPNVCHLPLSHFSAYTLHFPRRVMLMQICDPIPSPKKESSEINPNGKSGNVLRERHIASSPVSHFCSQTGKTHRVTLSNIHICRIWHDSWIMGSRKGKGERKRQISEQVLSGYVFVIPPFFFSFYVLLVLCLSPFYGDFMPRTGPEMTLKVPAYSKAKKLAKTKAHCCAI